MATYATWGDLAAIRNPNPIISTMSDLLKAYYLPPIVEMLSQESVLMTRIVQKGAALAVTVSLVAETP